MTLKPFIKAAKAFIGPRQPLTEKMLVEALEAILKDKRAKP